MRPGRPAPAQPRGPRRASSRVVDGPPCGRAPPGRRGQAPGRCGTGATPGSASAGRAAGAAGGGEGGPDPSTSPKDARAHGRGCAAWPRGGRRPVRRAGRLRQEDPSRTDDARGPGRPAPAQPRVPRRASSRVVDGSPCARTPPGRRGQAPGRCGTGAAPGSTRAGRAAGAAGGGGSGLDPSTSPKDARACGRGCAAGP